MHNQRKRGDKQMKRVHNWMKKEHKRMKKVHDRMKRAYKSDCGVNLFCTYDSISIP